MARSFHNMWRKIQANIEAMMRTLLPDGQEVCLTCTRPLIQPSVISAIICSSCAGKLEWIDEIQCVTCGRAQVCMDCNTRNLTSSQHLQLNRSAITYNDVAKQWLAAFKYRGDERYARLIADMMWAAWGKHQLPEIDLLTYVPISSQRLKERTFNQMQRVAQILSVKSGIPSIELLHRSLHTHQQSLKNKEARAKEVQHAFQTTDTFVQTLIQMQIPEHRNIHILLVDDVYTTGSTMHECARMMRTDLKAEIFGLTWARS